jgi:hypothetical protein
MRVARETTSDAVRRKRPRPHPRPLSQEERGETCRRHTTGGWTRERRRAGFAELQSLVSVSKTSGDS